MGQEPRFRSIYDAELPYVLRTLRRLGVRAADVEDLAHEVFLVVYRKLDEYDSSRPIRSWLFGIAFRATAHHFERAHQRREVAASVPERADEAPTAEQQLEDAEARTAVIDALSRIRIVNRRCHNQIAKATRSALSTYGAVNKTLTNDNGREFSTATASELEKALGVSVFFTEPAAPWQRGSVENLNGLIRQ